MINSIILPDMDNDRDIILLEGSPGNEDALEYYDKTSFIARPPNEPREIELIQAWADNPNREEN